MTLPRAYVSSVTPRPQLDGFSFRVDLPDSPICGRIMNRVDLTEAVVDRAVEIVKLAKAGFEVIYETGLGQQSGRLVVAEPYPSKP